MNKYWIQSLSEWAPEAPVYSCKDIDDAIESIENVRKINKELREALEEAINIIHYLDWRIVELKAKASLSKENKVAVELQNSKKQESGLLELMSRKEELLNELAEIDKQINELQAKTYK